MDRLRGGERRRMFHRQPRQRLIVFKHYHQPEAYSPAVAPPEILETNEGTVNSGERVSPFGPSSIGLAVLGFPSVLLLR